MRASEYRQLSEQLRSDGWSTSQIIERWVAERGLHPREAARLSHGWTQQQAADQWNELWPDPEHPCTRKHVSNWETSRQPSLETLNRLARVYRCAAGDLLGGEDYSHLDGRRSRPGAAMLSVAVTTVVHDGAVLLVRSRGGGWQFPSGVVKPHEDAAERAVEETAAETGIRCQVAAELGGRVHPQSGAWCEYFRADYLAGQIVNGQPAENSDVTWAPLPALTKFIARDRIFAPVLDMLEDHMTEPTPEPTVAMAIVTSQHGVLLARRRDGKPPWTFLGGGIEDGESPSDAAVREVKEEAGLVVTAGSVLGQRVHPKTGKAMAYVACSPADGLEVVVGDPDDHAEVRWVPSDEAQQLLPQLFEPVAEHLRATLT
jgi:8-oxo-dGTP pyrophosphatase MutT (NUDIX family)